MSERPAPPPLLYVTPRRPMTPESSQSDVARRATGYQVVSTYCRACAPEGVRDYYPPMREGDDHGVPYTCDDCGEQLLPCEHEWGEWKPWWQGGEFRSCSKDHCGEIERR